MSDWLPGRRALVVGAGSGIGRAVVDAFRAEDVEKALQLIDDEMPMKRLLTLIEMAKQDRTGSGAVQGHIPMEQFAECMADIGA